MTPISVPVSNRQWHGRSGLVPLILGAHDHQLLKFPVAEWLLASEHMRD
jgi:hypothetical protein